MFLTTTTEAGSFVFFFIYIIVLFAAIALIVTGLFFLLKWITRNFLEINITIKRKNKNEPQ